MHKIIFIFLAACNVLLIPACYSQQAIRVITSNKGIELIYNGKTRLSGGKPQIENQKATLKGTVDNANAITYKFDQYSDIETWREVQRTTFQLDSKRTGRYSIETSYL